MGRLSRVAGVVGAAAGLWLGGGVSGPLAAAQAQAQASRPAPVSDLLIYAQEWSLDPSRDSVPAGRIDVELWNRGEDAHDVRVRRLNAGGEMVGPVLAGVSVTPSGAIHHAVWHLGAGHYELYCSMPGHLAMGMHATLTVVTPAV